VKFAVVTLCVASQRVFIVVVYFVMTQSGNFWIHPRVLSNRLRSKVFGLSLGHILKAATVTGKEGRPTAVKLGRWLELSPQISIFPIEKFQMVMLKFNKHAFTPCKCINSYSGTTLYMQLGNE
jgi:hypothetical protein